MHVLAFIVKIFTVSLEAADIGIVFQVTASQKRHRKPHRAGWKSRTMSLRIGYFCAMKSKIKRRTEITYLMFLMLALPVLLCQCCDEEIKERQQSNGRIEINRSSGT